MDTGTFDKWQFDMSERLTKIETQQESTKDTLRQHDGKVSGLDRAFAEVKGAHDAAIPALQQDVRRAFEMQDEAEKDNDMYKAMARASAADIQEINRRLEYRVSQEAMRTLEQTLLGKIENLRFWLKIGLVGVGCSILLWAVGLILWKFFGVPAP